MNFLIVYAHYETKSFNSTLREQAEKTLLQLGHEVVISDLYAQSFNPVADKSDFITVQNEQFLKYDQEQLFASKNNLYHPEIKLEQEKVKWADCIIFIFPLWWYSTPAIMRGWFDKILSNGFAYTTETGFSKGLLTNKTAQLVITTGAPEVAFNADGAGTIDDILRGLTHGMFRFCGIKVLPNFTCYAVDSISREERIKYLELFDCYLKNISSVKERDLA